MYHSRTVPLITFYEDRGEPFHKQQHLAGLFVPPPYACAGTVANLIFQCTADSVNTAAGSAVAWYVPTFSCCVFDTPTVA